jgi:hypothetical protein
VPFTISEDVFNLSTTLANFCQVSPTIAKYLLLTLPFALLLALPLILCRLSCVDIGCRFWCTTESGTTVFWNTMPIVLTIYFPVMFMVTVTMISFSSGLLSPIRIVKAAKPSLGDRHLQSALSAHCYPLNLCVFRTCC